METIEKKTSAYVNARERAYKVQQTCDNPIIMKWIGYIFPELAESEDERIRKEMIFYFTEEIPQCSIQEHSDKMREFISWLKRQEVECTKLELKAGNSYFCYKSLWERTDSETFKKGLIYKCNKDGVLDNFVIKNPEQHFIEIKDERIAWLEKQTSNRYIVGADVGSPDGDNWCRFDYCNANIQQTDYAEQKPTDLSKDAKIRESLMEFVKLNMLTSDERYAKYLTWLEKQKEADVICNDDEKIRKDILAFIRREGQHIDKYKWHNWIAWLEKQKPVEHEDIDKLSLEYKVLSQTPLGMSTTYLLTEK